MREMLLSVLIAAALTVPYAVFALRRDRRRRIDDARWDDWQAYKAGKLSMDELTDKYPHGLFNQHKEDLRVTRARFEAQIQEVRDAHRARQRNYRDRQRDQS